MHDCGPLSLLFFSALDPCHERMLQQESQETTTAQLSTISSSVLRFDIINPYHLYENSDKIFRIDRNIEIRMPVHSVKYVVTI